MEASGDCVLSMATANPGVLVSAPAISPTRLGVSMSKKYFSPTPVRQAEATISKVIRISVFPLLRNELKKPGPAWIPMVKINNTSPKFPSSLGIDTPQWPNASAMKMTADTSSESPAILIRPSIKPKATIRKIEK